MNVTSNINFHPTISYVYVIGWILVVLLFAGVILGTNMAETVLGQTCVSNDPRDLDGDFIPNDWELNGIDINNDSIVDLDLPALGFSPVHKDLALEADYMIHHRPYPNIDNNVVSAFERTISDSACNPDGTKGINLHFEISDEIPHQDSLIIFELINGTVLETWNGLDDIKNEWFGNASQRESPNSANILDAKRQIYHYVLFGHTFNDQPSSGISRGIPGMDFIVSLGHDSWPKVRGHSVGTPALQEGTLMHEFGHNLGLSHGGADHLNNKPNYFSVMNYQLQMPTLIDNRPLDFSQCSVPTIDETNLAESNGIGQSCPPEQLMFLSCPPHVKDIVPAGEPIDFNGDGDLDDVNVTADLNCDADTTTLIGYDDWSHIKYIGTSEGGAVEGDSQIGVPGNETELKTTEGTLGQFISSEIDELTFSDVVEQVANKLDIVTREINDTQGVQSPASAAPRASEAAGRPQAPPQPELRADLHSIKEAYSAVLGTGNLSTLSHIVSLPADFGPDNTTKGLILSNNIDEAIGNAEAILSTFDSVMGGLPENDFITNPADQLRIGGVLESTIQSLKSLTCTYSECSGTGIS